MQWCMHVTGATRCLLAVEQRIDTGVGFLPGSIDLEWVERDEQIISELVTLADEFLTEMDRQADEGPRDVDEELDTLGVNYLRGLDAEKEGKALKEDAYRAIVAAGRSQESPMVRITFTPGKPAGVETVEAVDEVRAKRAKGGKALHAALSEARTALRDAQKAWDEHCEKFVTTREVERAGSKPRATITHGKAWKGMKK